MKIAVCVPVHGDMKADFGVSMSRALIATAGAPQRPSLEFFVNSNSMLPVGRTMLVRRALEWGADYLLWADADHTFPPDSIARLLRHNVDVVGANYRRRAHPNAPTAIANGLPVYRNGEGLQEVETMGLGLCLMRTRVLAALKAPLFAFEMHEDGSYVGEDTFLFRKIRAAGHKIYIDHGLSEAVGHVSERLLMGVGRGDADTDHAPAGA